MHIAVVSIRLQLTARSRLAGLFVVERSADVCSCRPRFVLLYVCMYTYIYIYIYTHMHVYIYIYNNNNDNNINTNNNNQ